MTFSFLYKLIYVREILLKKNEAKSSTLGVYTDLSYNYNLKCEIGTKKKKKLHSPIHVIILENRRQHKKVLVKHWMSEINTNQI